MLTINSIVITHNIIFCFLWDFSSPHSAHGQSCNTRIQDNPNIKAENTNNQGSIHSGINDVWAISGANSPITDNTIGKTQQNKWGNIDAITPIFTALFFIFTPFFLASPAGLEPASNS